MRHVHVRLRGRLSHHTTWRNHPMLKRLSLVAALGLGAAAALPPFAARAADEAPAAAKPDADGFVSIFNGKDLTGWQGFEGYWSVKDGAISGNEEKATSKHT